MIVPGLKVFTTLLPEPGVNSFTWEEAPKFGGKIYAVNVTRLDDADIDELMIVRLPPISMGGTITFSTTGRDTLSLICC